MDWRKKEREKEIPEILNPVLKTLDALDEIKSKETKFQEYEFYRYRYRRRYLIEPFLYEEDFGIYPGFSGEDLVKNMIEHELLVPDKEKGSFKCRGNSITVNVIPAPPDAKPGCCEILIVFIGNRDHFETRLLEAIKCCGVMCRGITKHVILYAMKWNSIIWEKHENSFLTICHKDKLESVTRKMYGEHFEERLI